MRRVGIWRRRRLSSTASALESRRTGHYISWHPHKTGTNEDEACEDVGGRPPGRRERVVDTRHHPPVKRQKGQARTGLVSEEEINLCLSA